MFAACASGAEYVFLSPGGSHYRRSTYGERYFRPAADGWYPERLHRSARPVLIDASALYPGMPLPAWPAAVPGETFIPPTGRGVTRFISDPHTGRCPVCRSDRPRHPGDCMEDRRWRCHTPPRLPEKTSLDNLVPAYRARDGYEVSDP